MTMITLIEQAKESAKQHIANDDVKVEEFSETLKDGSVVTCIAVCSSNAFETTIGHVKITWKLNGKRATGALIQKLFIEQGTDAEKKDIADYAEQQKFLKKFGF